MASPCGCAVTAPSWGCNRRFHFLLPAPMIFRSNAMTRTKFSEESSASICFDAAPARRAGEYPGFNEAEAVVYINLHQSTKNLQQEDTLWNMRMFTTWCFDAAPTVLPHLATSCMANAIVPKSACVLQCPRWWMKTTKRLLVIDRLILNPSLFWHFLFCNCSLMK